MRSPVSLSRPTKSCTVPDSTARSISGVLGYVPAVSPRVVTSTRPALLRNCSSMRSPSSKAAASSVALR